MHPPPGTLFDVFVSFTRKGHPELARRIHTALEDAGLRVFIDDEVGYGDPISETLVDRLENSRLLIVVYSERYLERDACQWELMRVYLAGMAEGAPSRRILVVNPEIGDDHIAPPELSDARYLAAGAEFDMDGLVRAVKRRVRELPGPIGKVRVNDPPRWLPPRIPGTADFVGRYRDMWRLHTQLCADLPLTHATTEGPAAMVSGLPGIGKTSLAYAYAWRFGAAYPAGVYVTSLRGADPATARFRQAEHIRQLARSAGIPVAGVDHEELRILLAEHLDGRPGPCLLIVDDVPGGLEPEALDELVVPARRMRTIFTSRDAGAGARAGTVQLTGLAETEGARLLAGFRPLDDPEDRAAARRISVRLGGHPLALRMVAAALRNRQGLRSYAEYAADLETDLKSGLDEERLLSVIGGLLGLLGEHELLVIELAHILGAQPVPAWLVDAVLGAVGSGTPDTGSVLDRLDELAAAHREGSWWHVHPLVGQAAHQAGRVAALAPSLAFAAARGLLGLAPGPEPGCARLAETLAGSPILTDTDEAYRLYGLAAGHHKELGDVVETARVRSLITTSPFSSAADIAAAALACNASGEYGRAEEFARRALAMDAEFAALWGLAAALDGLGRYGEADASWQRLDREKPPPTFTPDRLAAFRVGRAEAHLARGEQGDAAALLEGVRRDHDITKADDATAHQINAATVELARLRLQTSSEKDARALAKTVIEFYRARAAETHAMCQEAKLVWAEATVALELFEVRPDTSKWGEAEWTLRDLYESFRSSAGPESTLTLKAAVQHALVLVRLGRQSESRAVLEEVVPLLEARFGQAHPLWLRTQYILGLAHLQLSEFAAARDVLERTWNGQRTTLGPRHYETLRTQLELGIVLKFFDQRRMRDLVTDVRRSLPKDIGRRNDLYGRALAAERLLFPMPVWTARALWRAGELADRLLGLLKRPRT
ncbi:TIR domain-containing protein [Actinomadura luteofluorescens]|uniref:tetratricopeptide repeat protein n=1 Tax=Actinomadura luteofluorescens TaxID=46163 RepID=UPI00346E5F38